jgi:lipoprotein-releasing system permease protein
MSFRLALRIAIRHLLSRKRQSFLATLGVAVGGAIFAMMVAVTEGQEGFLREKLIDFSPHIIVKSERVEPLLPRNLLTLNKGEFLELRVNTPPSVRKEVRPYTELVARLERLAPSIAMVAPYVAIEGVFRNGTRFVTVDVRGIDPEREKEVARLGANMREGGLALLGRTPNGVAIGRGLAQKLRVKLGESFNFITPSGRVEPLKVVAIFESGVAGLDDRRGYINLILAQGLRGMQRNAVTGLSVELRSLDNITEVRDQIQGVTGYVAETWEESNRGLLDFQGRQRDTTRILVIFVFITAAFGIANTLVAIVLQKRRDIAVMKGFGVSRRGVGRIFLLEGLFLGLVGGIAAALAGYGLAYLFGTLDIFPKNNSQSYIRFDRFPVSLDPAIYLLTFALSAFMAVTASWFPARRAARLLPLEIIRREA